jgi:tetratricopeptide (TPR) repeat protein
MRLLSVWVPCLVALLLFPSFGSLSQVSDQSLESFLARAKELEKREDYEGAEKLYQQALIVFPDQTELVKRLGIVYQTELKFADSIDAFEKALRANPKYPEVNFYLGLSYFGLNELERALAAFEQELRVNPGYRRAHYYAAVVLQSLERKVDAIQHLATLVKDDPTDNKVWYQLARLHRSLALQAFKQIPQDSELFHALRAESYVDDEKYPDAINEYQEVLKKEPGFPGVHFALGELYYKTQNTVQAEIELRKTLQEDPNHPLANYYLGELLLRSQKPDEALILLKTATSGEPKLMLAHFYLGKCYLALGKLEDALQALLRASELDPTSKHPHFVLAQVYARLKNQEKQRYHLAIFEKLNQEEKSKFVEKASDDKTKGK